METLAKHSHVFIDANAFMYRYHYGHQNAEVVHPMQAVKSFLALIWKIRHQVEPSLLVVTMDSKESNFRHKIDKAYKANRDAMPAALSDQFRPLYLALKFMAVNTWIEPGFEADDLLASLCAQVRRQGRLNYVLTMDKDLAQIVDQQNRWVSAADFTVMNETEVVKQFGVKPEQIAELLALTGDTVDNIPGAPGIGKKVGADLLNRYGGLDALLRNRNWIKGKVGEALRENIERINLNRQLTTLRADIRLPNLNQLQEQPEKLSRLCEHYNLA